MPGYSWGGSSIRGVNNIESFLGPALIRMVG